MKKQKQTPAADLLRYCVGIDVGKDTLHLCVSAIDADGKVSVKGSRQFPNRVPAFEVLEAWCAKHCKDESLPVRYLMESTGVYHEQIAWHLFRADRQTSVVLPNKAKHYLMSLGHKSKNDKIDARGLAQMGLEQSLPLWQPLSKEIYTLRMLTRQHGSGRPSAVAGIEKPVPEPAARDHAQPDCRPIHHQAVEYAYQALRQAGRANRGADRQASVQGCRVESQDRSDLPDQGAGPAVGGHHRGRNQRLRRLRPHGRPRMSASS